MTEPTTQPTMTQPTMTQPTMTQPGSPSVRTEPEPGRSATLPQRIDSDPESVQRDLLRLVLTIIELVRQLMERQALRKVDEGDLSEDQVEELGLGLMHLEEAMNELQDRFDIAPEELNIDLGPLGPLLPRGS